MLDDASACTKRMFSSPGSPKTTSTPSFSRHSTISSAALLIGTSRGQGYPVRSADPSSALLLSPLWWRNEHDHISYPWRRKVEDMTAVKPETETSLTGYWGSDNSQHVNFIGLTTTYTSSISRRARVGWTTI